MNKKIYYVGQKILLLFFIALFFNEAQAAQNIKIEVPEVIYTDKDSFMLGQAAKITGGNQQTRRILSRVEIFPNGNIFGTQTNF